jgi:hypothetical protein
MYVMCFIRTRSEEPYRANCCARYPLPEGVGEYVVSCVMRSNGRLTWQHEKPSERGSSG